MNEYSTEAHKNRGRVIAHVFYSELEKIARFGPSGRQFTSALKGSGKLLEQDIAHMHGAQPKKGIFNILSKSRRQARASERGMKGVHKQDTRLAGKRYEQGHRAAMRDLSKGSPAEQEAARKWLADSGGGVSTYSSRARGNPTGKGAEGSGFFSNVGKATTAVGVGGAALYGGKKYLDSKNQSPYGAYSGAY
jgi:hypothetical protein